jgi:uncharacterized protein (AIM24 family)
MTDTQCPWCGAQFAVTSDYCPRCGAPVDVRLAVDASGWVEAPGMKDMATIQIGQSRAQIEGTQVPVVDMNLAAGDSVYCTHDKLLWHDGQVQLGNRKGGNVFKRARAGMPLVLLEATGPGRIAFSDNHPGELVAVPMDPGMRAYTREHHMLLATGNVGFDGKRDYVWYVTETQGSDGDTERETHHPMGTFVDEFFSTDDRPGMVLLHAIGNVFVRRLGPGEAVNVAPHSLLAWTGSGPQLLIEQSFWGNLFGMRGRWANISSTHYLSLRVQGPAHVWIQSGCQGRTEEFHPIVQSSGYIRAI